MAYWVGLGTLVMFLVGSQTAPLNREDSSVCPDLNAQQILDIDQWVTSARQCSLCDRGMAFRFVLLLLLCLGGSVGDRCRPFTKHQGFVDLDMLMGEWYAVEIVDHNKGVEHNTISTVIDACPILRLSREDDNTIRLQWNENAGVFVYKFRQPTLNHPGFWDSADPQNGSLVERYNVQVMKAVSSHMVLTFCSRLNRSMFSVLMSRSRRLPTSEVRGVNNMLVRRKLLQGQVKEMCKGAASTIPKGRIAVVVILVAHFLSSCH